MSYVEKNPQRQCAVTRQSMDKSLLLRFVLTPDGAVMADFKGTLPGRGIYAVPSKATLGHFLNPKRLSGAFKVAVTIFPSIEDIEVMVEKDVLNRLSLNKKANRLIIGGDEVRANAHKLKVLFVAVDAGTDAQKRAEATAGAGGLVVRKFDRNQLEKTLGVPNCTLVGVTSLDIFGQTLHKYNDFLGIMPAKARQKRTNDDRS